jgi:hypothetical protein
MTALDGGPYQRVMAGLVPAIHVLLATKKDVDARHKAGHDGGECGGMLELTNPAGNA